METNPFKSLLVFGCSIRAKRLVRKWNIGKDVSISLILEVLLVLEDWVEIVHTSPCQKTNISDHASHATHGESSSTETN